MFALTTPINNISKSSSANCFYVTLNSSFLCRNILEYFTPLPLALAELFFCPFCIPDLLRSVTKTDQAAVLTHSQGW